ncbi:MAG TPA: alpha-ribazole phosphatase [Anaerolineales bacterium]|nr:alpha-ribazole phosphatase [Anaerolineales bacterium]
MKLFLTRHGQTDWNIARRYQGHSNTELNQVGIRQAEQLAKRLLAETIHAIYSSDLSRAMTTAEIIANAQEQAPVFRSDMRWRELSFGNWEGMTYREMSAHSPELFDAWMKDSLTISTPNGETHRQLAERVQAAFDEIKAKHKEETVLVVGHSGSMQTLLALLLGVDLSRYWQFRVSQASLSELTVYEDSVTLNLFNDVSHLIS